MRKLSRPWHGPYRVTALREPDTSVSKVYQPQSPAIYVHQSRVKPCPCNFPAGFYWHGGNNKGPGRPPKWVDQLLERDNATSDITSDRPVYDQETDICSGLSENKNLKSLQLMMKMSKIIMMMKTNKMTIIMMMK